MTRFDVGNFCLTEDFASINMVVVLKVSMNSVSYSIPYTYGTDHELLFGVLA